MKNSVIKKGNFYKGLSKDSYNINRLMVKNMNDSNLFNTFLKNSQFQRRGILKL
jgi:hypothetical protein